MELVPQPLANLIRRIEREPASTKDRCFFDLPWAKTWKGTPADLDLSRRFHGERAANVVGPAAGPQTQLAQNIALSYLAGSRILELKTVQILDELQIPRPCIDAANVGFNVEWSQELRIHQSRDEYAKAALLLAALFRLGVVREDHLLDLSLGYDLKGVRSDAITGFVREMLDASKTIDRLLAELPADLSRYRDLSVNPRLINCVTLSTFHGCPAHEIEGIARYLLEELGLHVVVKLNPTLLGFEALQSILHDQLGYRELTVRKATFEKDLQWSDALSMIARLRSIAKKVGRTFGVKLTNTLVVDNHKSFFTEKEMYLSGQPLHVLSTQVLKKVRDALPIIGDGEEPPVVYSFSAGIDQHNFPLAVSADLYPVTTCTDLLRPGGYARLPKYLDNLATSMNACDAKTIEEYVLRAQGEALGAMKDAVPAIMRAAASSSIGAIDESALLRAAESLVSSDSSRDARAWLKAEGVSADAIELAHSLWVHQAGTRNTRHLAQAALDDPRYRKAANTKVPKKIGSHLELFDCVNCDKCVPVCPNDANFAYDTKPLKMSAPTWLLEGGAVSEGEPIKVEIEEAHQLATFVDFCNACGNCDVFCPEDGGPYVMKPHWFGSEEAMSAEGQIDGFALESKDAIIGRIAKRRVRLAIDRRSSIGSYEDDAVEAKVRFHETGLELLSHRHKTPEVRAELRGADLMVLKALLDGVQTSVNPISATLSGTERG